MKGKALPPTARHSPGNTPESPTVPVGIEVGPDISVSVTETVVDRNGGRRIVEETTGE